MKKNCFILLLSFLALLSGLLLPVYGEELNKRIFPALMVLFSDSTVCPKGPQTVMWKGLEQQRCDDINRYYTLEGAKNYCQNLSLSGHSDWRLPTKDELKSLVVCTNSTLTPLVEWPDHPSACWDGNSAPFKYPTIDEQFLSYGVSYWSSSLWINKWNIEDYYWVVVFNDGHAQPLSFLSILHVRCVR